MPFTIFQNEKTPFQAIKTRSSKSQKIAIFLKGLTNGFGPKMAIFSTSFFGGNIGQENVFYDILEQKNAILGYKKRSSKTRKIAIILKELTHGFCSKLAIIPTSFFQAMKARKRSLFSIFQNEKTHFKAIKKEVQKSKNCHFSKGVNPWFWSKNDHFSNFFFVGKIGQEYVFYHIL